MAAMPGDSAEVAAVGAAVIRGTARGRAAGRTSRKHVARCRSGWAHLEPPAAGQDIGTAATTAALGEIATACAADAAACAHALAERLAAPPAASAYPYGAMVAPLDR